MSKQKLAEMVLQKMQQKKLQEERNRPHQQVLQLFVKFQAEQYFSLLTQINLLQNDLEKEIKAFKSMEGCLQDLENTGKKNYPRIIINPEFIASESVQPLVKEFYRKASNTFLREFILKKKKFQQNLQQMSSISELFLSLKEREEKSQQTTEKNVECTNSKRLRNLKEDLRLRSIREQKQQVQKTINQEKQHHRDLLREYDIKKLNLQARMDYCEQLASQIQKQKDLIQKTYNPVAYREYLKTVFGIRTKNEYMQNNLYEVFGKVSQIQDRTKNRQRFLEKKYRVFVQGKCADSPSKKKNARKTEPSSSPFKRRSKSEAKLTIKPARMMTEKFGTPTGRKKEVSFGSVGRTAANSNSKAISKDERSNINLSDLKETRNSSYLY